MRIMLFTALLLPAPGALAQPENAMAANPLKDLAGSTKDEGRDLPLLIKSDSLQVNAAERRFIYEGNVRAERGDILLTSDRMIGRYNEKNELETVVCEKNVVITRGSDLRATAEHAFYDVQAAMVELTEGPELINKGNALTADKVKIYLNEDRSEAEGDVRVRVVKESAAAAEAVPGLSDLQ